MLSSLSSPSTISMFSAVEDLQDDSLAPLLTHHAAFEETVWAKVIHSDSECLEIARNTDMLATHCSLRSRASLRSFVHSLPRSWNSGFFLPVFFKVI